MLLSPRDGGSGKRAKVQKRGFTFLCHRQRFSSRSTYMLFMRYGACGAFINTPARNSPTLQGREIVTKICFAWICEADQRRTRSDRELFTGQDSGQLEAVEWKRTPRVGPTHAQRRRAGQR